eukprot:14727436-Alexandrium_andersonii.AAC.1
MATPGPRPKTRTARGLARAARRACPSPGPPPFRCRMRSEPRGLRAEGDARTEPEGRAVTPGPPGGGP